MNYSLGCSATWTISGVILTSMQEITSGTSTLRTSSWTFGPTIWIVQARWEVVAADQEQGLAPHDAHTLNQLVKDTQKVLLEYINRWTAVFKPLSMRQGSQLAQNVIAEVKDQARLTKRNIQWLCCLTKQRGQGLHTMKRLYFGQRHPK